MVDRVGLDAQPAPAEAAIVEICVGYALVVVCRNVEVDAVAHVGKEVLMHGAVLPILRRVATGVRSACSSELVAVHTTRVVEPALALVGLLRRLGPRHAAPGVMQCRLDFVALRCNGGCGALSRKKRRWAAEERTKYGWPSKVDLPGGPNAAAAAHPLP